MADQGYGPQTSPQACGGCPESAGLQEPRWLWRWLQLQMRMRPLDCALVSLAVQDRDGATQTWTLQILLRPFLLPREGAGTTTWLKSQRTMRQQNEPAQSRSSSRGRASAVHASQPPQHLLLQFLSLLLWLWSLLWVLQRHANEWWQQERFLATTPQVFPCAFSGSCVRVG